MLHVCEDSEIERLPQSAARPVCNLTPAVWKNRWLSVGRCDKREGKWRGEGVIALAVSYSDQNGHCGQTSHS